MPAARRAPAPRAARDEAPRSRLDVDERRRQLVALGLELFSTRTYDDVSVDELAREAGISKGLLYHYFPTKRDFYVATVREAARQLLERTDTASTASTAGTGAPGDRDPLERLRAGMDAYLDYVAGHAAAYGALLRGGVGTDAEVDAIVDETREAFVARFLEGAPLGDRAAGPLVRIALRGCLGFIEAATLEWIDDRRGVKRDTLRELFVQVVWRVLATATQPP